MSAKPETTLELVRSALDIAIRDRRPEDLRELASRWLPKAREAVTEILGKPTSERSFAELADLVEAWLTEDPAQRLERRIEWPIATLNAMTSGLERGVMTTLATRTSMGKSAFALDLAVEHAARHKGDVLILSHELPYKLVAKRLAARLTGIARWKVDEGLLSVEERRRMSDAIAQLRTFRGSVNDSARDVDTAVEWIRTRARRSPVDVIIVDYLQLGASTASTRRHEQIADITLRLIDAARESDAALLALAQINRDGSESPQLHHLRDSGSIEQDSRTVLIVDRPFARQVPEALPCEATAWLAKNGEGATGQLKLHFDVAAQRFTEEECQCRTSSPTNRQRTLLREVKS